MPSKREREYARRRHQKRMARAAKAERRRRDRTIAAVSVLVITGLVVAAVAVSWAQDPESDATGTDPAVTDTAVPEPQPTPEIEPLPTTNPAMYQAAPPASDSLNQDWNVTLTTTAGDITMVLHGADAPQAVANFVFLAKDGFFNGTACHRLLPDSLLQCGDPTAQGSGDAGYAWGPIENAPADDIYPAGTVAMARQPENGESMGSQFFLVFNEVTLPADSAGGYAVFGEITGGIEILQQIGAAGNGIDGVRPAVDVIITDVEVA